MEVGISHTTARALLNKGHEKVCREVFWFFLFVSEIPASIAATQGATAACLHGNVPSPLHSARLAGGLDLTTNCGISLKPRKSELY